MNAWEQRKFGELSKKTFGGGTPNTSNNEYWNSDIPWFQSSDIPDGKLFNVAPKKFISQDGLSKSAAQLIPENSIAIITRVGVGKLAFVPFSYTTSQDFLSLSKLNLGREVNWDWFILLVAKTGMRFSEALALTPRDFDFAHQSVFRTDSRIAGG